MCSRHFTGILGIVLMYFSVRVGTILLDLRYLAVILAVIIGGDSEYHNNWYDFSN